MEGGQPEADLTIDPRSVPMWWLETILCVVLLYITPNNISINPIRRHGLIFTLLFGDKKGYTYLCLRRGGIETKAVSLPAATPGKGEAGIISPLPEGGIALCISSFERVMTVAR